MSAQTNAKLREKVADLEEQLRLSTEKIGQLQRAEESTRQSYETAHNALKVAQAYVQQLAGNSVEVGAGVEGFATTPSASEQVYETCERSNNLINDYMHFLIFNYRSSHLHMYIYLYT